MVKVLDKWIALLMTIVLTHVNMNKENYNSFYNRTIKPIIGFMLALLLLLILWPIYLIIAIFVALESGFPVIYAPLRGGYGNKPFHIYKFRSMVKDADKIGGGTTAFNDPRITKVGNFLRKTKLDELPQLFNILGGTMSFIGPRPELLQYVNLYEGEEKLILRIRPGITDFSSIEFINLDEVVGADNADEMYEKLVLKRKNELRVKYAKQVSFYIDCYLFFNTVKGVIIKVVKFISN